MKPLLLLLALLCMIENARCQSLTWTRSSSGLPDGFCCNCLAITSAGKVLAGGDVWGTFDYELYSSINNGNSWQQVADSGLTFATGSYFFTALAYKSDGTTFMGAGGAGQVGGVFTSTSDGSSWTRSSSGLPDGFCCNCLAITSTGKVLAGGDIWGTFDYELYSSINNGNSWQQVADSGLTFATGSYFFTALAYKSDGTTFMGAGGAAQVGGVFTSTSMSSAANLPQTQVLSFSLDQDFPNPFNPSTKIQYVLPRESRVVLKVYNMLGQEVATLVDELKQPGRYSVQWDGSNAASGLYFYQLKAGDFVETKKLVLLR